LPCFFDRGKYKILKNQKNDYTDFEERLH